MAVLDWDQGTRGDSLFDLATTLSYYTEAGDPPAMHTLRQMPTGEAGFPGRLAVAERYARQTGRDLSNFRFHRVLAILQARDHLPSATPALPDRRDPGSTLRQFGSLADGILEFAHLVARGDVF